MTIQPTRPDPGHPENYHPPYAYPPVPSSNGALWSVILGVVGLLIHPLTLLGLPLALVALGDIRRGAKTGLGMAVAGIVLNGVVWLFWVVVGISAAIGSL